MRLSVAKNNNELYSKWRQRLVDYVKDFQDVQVLAKDTASSHILSISFYQIKGEVAVNYFQKNGIIISTSSACSSQNGRAGHVIDAIKLPESYKRGVIRLSFGENNTEDDIAHFETVFSDFIKLLGRGKSYEME